MTTTANIYDAKTQLSRLVDRAAAGEEVVIARAGKPLARLMPLASAGPRRPGLLKGLVIPRGPCSIHLPMTSKSFGNKRHTKAASRHSRAHGRSTAAGCSAGGDSPMGMLSSWSAPRPPGKSRLGNIDQASARQMAGRSFKDLARRSRFRALAISLAHAIRAGSLGATPRDPFDRMLIAQAQAKLAVVVTGDPVFRSYNVPVIHAAAATSASP